MERLGQPAFICLWLALVTLLVYVPVFHAQFVGFDDPDYVTGNPHVLRGITLANLHWAFITNHAAYWHPVTWISLMLNSQYFGSGAGAFHAVNLLLHVAVKYALEDTFVVTAYLTERPKIGRQVWPIK